MTLLAEQRISLSDLACAEGVCPSTAWRWCSVGARGVKLESFAIGGLRYTTREAFVRFAQASTAAADGDVEGRAHSMLADPATRPLTTMARPWMRGR